MIDIGRKGIFTVSPPYFLSPVEYEVIAIQSIAAMLTLGLDPYKLVYAPAGLDTEFYQNAAKSTQICLLKSAIDVRYIPRDAIIHEDVASYVNYADKAMVVLLGSHPAANSFSNLVSSVAKSVVAQIGVSPVIEVRDISKYKQYSIDEHTIIQTDRLAKITSSTPADTTALREKEVQLLTNRIKALEQFLILYSQECTTECMCTPTADVYADNVVFYQYSLADYYMQASRGDIHDLPVNNAFIDRLHQFNVTDYIHQFDQSSGLPNPCAI